MVFFEGESLEEIVIILICHDFFTWFISLLFFFLFFLFLIQNDTQEWHKKFSFMH